jgi:DNA polymerase-3 subunit beta
MKIQIEKKDLLNLVGKTQNIIEKRNSMAILVNILLDAHDNKLGVLATDLEISMTDSVATKVFSEGKVAVSSKSLCDITKELAEGPIQLTKKENNWLEIKQGKYSSKIIGISAEEYPTFPTLVHTEFTAVKIDTFREMIDKTIYSVSNDESRYHMNGVYFEPKAANYVMVATDGHRLSLITKPLVETSHLPQQGVIIPRKGLHEIRKLIETADGNLDLAIDGAQLVVKYKSTTLMVRLIEGKYPNYEQFIPQKLNEKISINREDFLQSLKRVSLLANHKSKAVTLNISEGKMEISSNNPEMGDAREEIEVGYSGKNLKIGFNAKYIQDVLQAIDEETVDLELNDQLSAGLMHPHLDQRYKCVVMPMRI